MGGGELSGGISSVRQNKFLLYIHNNFTFSFTARFRTVYKQSLSVLRRKMALPELSNVVERYCHELEMGEDFMKDFMMKLPKETNKVNT